MVNGSHIVQKYRDHNHDPDPTTQQVNQVINEIKRKTIETDECPVKIITSALYIIDSEVCPFVHKNKSLKQTVHRARNRNLVVKEPKNISEIILTDEFKYTKDKELFLLVDKFIENDRLIIFSTITDIKYLFE